MRTINHLNTLIAIAVCVFAANFHELSVRGHQGILKTDRVFHRCPNHTKGGKARMYSFPLEEFCSAEKFSRIKKFTADKQTPCVVIDLDVIKEKYLELREQLPFVKIYYALKANPHIEVAQLLHNLGSSFDVASRYELDELLSIKVDPSRISYGNTIKKPDDIAYFYQKGVRLFVTDSESDVLNLSKYAPGSKVFFRLLSDGKGADWPLSKKFGCHPDLARNLILKAKRHGLIPYGISFHVGSQQRDVGQWSTALTTAGFLFRWAKEKGIDLHMINMGGGFPAHYTTATRTLPEYALDIKTFLMNTFGTNEEEWPEILIEPGRSLVGDSGVLVSEIITIAKKSLHDLNKWVFLDVGKFRGLIETIDESIKYPIMFCGKGKEEEVILAGPTCDSMDILYEDYKYKMPVDAKPGSKVYIFSTGAYTQSYSSVCFNGFPPLDIHILK